MEQKCQVGDAAAGCQAADKMQDGTSMLQKKSMVSKVQVIWDEDDDEDNSPEASGDSQNYAVQGSSLLQKTARVSHTNPPAQHDAAKNPSAVSAAEVSTIA